MSSLHFSKFRRMYREAATLLIASSLEDLEICPEQHWGVYFIAKGIREAAGRGS